MPFLPVPGHVGSDYDRLRPDFRVIANPWNPSERVMLVPAIRPDVALIHALAADRAGMLLLDHMEDDVLLAQASRVVVASAERIVPSDDIRRAPEGAVLEGIHVAAVVECPGGARPTLVRGVYDLDGSRLEEYVAAAQDDVTFKEYLARYVDAPAARA